MSKKTTIFITKWLILTSSLSIVFFSTPQCLADSLSITLNRSLLVDVAEDNNIDLDHDALVDSLEGFIAYKFRPLFIFDSDEGARLSGEPVTIFQVHPVDIRKEMPLKISIKWVFLFRYDGGYGPDSDCSDSHDGDNDDVQYDLVSYDGITWSVVKIKLSFKGLEWPTNSNLEIYSSSHPVIYFSAHKHHEYFNTNWDHQDSLYSDWGCNDDVNGQGAQVLSDVDSLEVEAGFYNNVGEPGTGDIYHPTSRFVNDFSPYYPGYGAWDDNDFYSVGSSKQKWIKDPVYGSIYVGFWGAWTYVDGSSYRPLRYIEDAYNSEYFSDGSLINIEMGSYLESSIYPGPKIFTKPSVLRAINGPVTIGGSGDK